MVQRVKDSPYWFTNFTINGSRVRVTTRTENREEAEQYEAELKRQYWRQTHLDETPPRTWGATLIKYLQEAEKRSLDDDKQRLAVLTALIGTETVISTLNKVRCKEILDRLVEERQISNSTRNRYASVLQTVLNRAHHEWGWLDHPVRISKRKEELPEPIWITHAEAETLIAAAPDYWKNAIRFSLHTGLRQNNVMAMEWKWVDLARRLVIVPKAQFKGRKTHAVPLDNTATQCLREQWQAADKHPRWVFPKRTGKHEHLYPDSMMWDRLVRDTGITPGFRWHDLRHTWASWHVMAGTSLAELMELGGWSSYVMVQRYAHLSAGHLQAAAERLRHSVENALDNNSVPQIKRC